MHKTNDPYLSDVIEGFPNSMADMSLIKFMQKHRMNYN